MWSITATHPILRIFLYQYHASLLFIGSCGSHDVDRVQPHRVYPVTMPYQPLPYATWAILCFHAITYCYHDRACDGTVNQVGLVLNCGHLPIVTKHYQGSDLSLPRPSRTFTSPASAGNGNR